MQLSSCSIKSQFLEEANYMVIMQYFTREGSKLLLSSKNKLCTTKVVAKNDFQFKLLPQRAPS